MATTQNKEIGEADLIEYVDKESDFAFEVRVVKELSQYGSLEHGGTYIDPHTQKPRQFDIRMRLRDSNRVIRFAVECKNIKPWYPMLGICVPRSENEASMSVLFSLDVRRRTFPETDRGPFSAVGNAQTAKCFPLDGRSGGLYRAGAPVGKTITQVGRHKEGRVMGDDADVYTKWAQALSSSVDLVEESSDDGRASPHGYCFSCVVPVMVVPEGSLWSCEYDSDGNRTDVPKRVNRLQLYVGRECWVSNDGLAGKEKYTVTHLEVVTLAGFHSLIHELRQSPTLIEINRAKELVDRLRNGIG